MPQTPSDYRALAVNPAFQELMAWAEARFQQPHLLAKAPNTILPNYGEVAASDAAMYRVIAEMKRFLDKKSKKE